MGEAAFGTSVRLLATQMAIGGAICEGRRVAYATRSVRTLELADLRVAGGWCGGDATRLGGGVVGKSARFQHAESAEGTERHGGRVYGAAREVQSCGTP